MLCVIGIGLFVACQDEQEDTPTTKNADQINQQLKNTPKPASYAFSDSFQHERAFGRLLYYVEQSPNSKMLLIKTNNGLWKTEPYNQLTKDSVPANFVTKDKNLMYQLADTVLENGKGAVIEYDEKTKNYSGWIIEID